jgi:Transposase DDE domain
VLRRLLRQVCRPLATPETPGAYRFGLRLMAIDSTLEDVADTPANAAFFGRVASGASASPFPQARCLYLAEVGTHAIIDALFAPCRLSDHRLLPALLRSVEANMLVLLDRGVFSGPVFAALRAKGAHGLARLEAGMLTKPLRRLADGSYLVQLTPKTSRGLREPLTLRVIEYTLDPPVAAQMKQLAQSTTSRASDPTAVHRLVTTLLDPQRYPALELIRCYHERWEIELCVDELKIHLRLAAHPLRSRTPLGVLQELYGLLLLHYAVRSLMATSAAQADLDPDRLSFTHAIHVLGDALLLAPLLPVAAQPRFRQQVLADLRDPASLLPPRRLRFNPRVLKHSSHFRHKRSTDQGFHLKHRSFADILRI